MNRKDATEFRAVIAALVEEYAATRQELIAVAKALPVAPPRPAGRKRLDDSVPLNQAARMVIDGRVENDWQAAKAVAAQLHDRGDARAGNSLNATEQRLHRAMRAPDFFYKWFPDAARIVTEKEAIQLGYFRQAPFDRVYRALAKIGQK